MNRELHKKPVFFLMTLGFVFAAAASVYAETQYVSDQLLITMREGAGSEYKIIRMLKTGTPVEVLEKRDQYYKVQTEDGKSGWALKQYITPDIPKTIIISGLNEEIEGLKNSLEKLSPAEEVMTELEKSVNEKNNQIEDLTRELQKKTDQYEKLVEGSRDIAKTISERDMLTEENTRLLTEKADLSKENERLSERNAIYWFLSGGAVFFFGWIAGKISRKRRRY